MHLQLLDLAESSSHLPIEQAILEALAYSDVFDYPLRVEEIHRYLPVQATMDQVRAALECNCGLVGTLRGYYFVPGREEIVPLRLNREQVSRPTLEVAIRVGRALGHLPFIRMVALTGSLALLNSGDNADLDYMLVTTPGRVWTARAFAILMGRITARFGYTLCPNLIVSRQLLMWPQHDLYSAREISQMIPITGASLYSEFRNINAWTADFLPNAAGLPALAGPIPNSGRLLQAIQEWPLRGRLGSLLEAWERSRKILRFERQDDFGDETRFGADVCQGNFGHYGAKTREALQERLAHLAMHASVDIGKGRADG